MSTGVDRTIMASGAVVAALLFGAATAAAQPAAGGGWGAPPVREHDGIFFRVHIGPAYTQISAEEGGDELTISGSGGAFSIAVGHTVAPNLVLFGELFDDVAVDPTVEINGEDLGDADDVTAGAIGIGAGLAYYFPSNFYVSGTLAMAKLSIQEDGDEEADTDFGPGVSLQVGKEWWVANNWGLGVGLQVFAGTMSESIDDNEIDYTTTAAALVVSAVYN